MINSLLRCLTIAALGVIAFASPVAAREHSTNSHRGSYRHYRVHRAFAYRHREARYHGRRRRLYASFAVPGAAANDWQQDYGWQQNAWQQKQWQQPSGWQPQDFSGYRSFDGYAEWRAGSYQERHARRRAERSVRSGLWRAGVRSVPFGQGFGAPSPVAGMADQQAVANRLPLSLVHRVIMRESGGNPRAVHSGNYGLMQIRLGTARAMGYSGSAAGLLDPQTNMIYAMRYLAGAYRAAGGNESRAIALYARGYNARPYPRDGQGFD